MLRLQESSHLLIQSNSPDELYGEIVKAAVSIMRSEIGTMQAFHPELGKLRLLASVGIEPEAVSLWEWVSVEAGTPCAEALRTVSRVVAGDIETCDFMAGTSDLDALRKSGIRAVQSTPLISRTGDLLGMITTLWTKPHLPSERDLRMLDLLARQAADLIERSHADESLRQLNVTLEQRVAKRTGELKALSDRLRLLASKLVETEQRERRRIAALLHDHLQQLLVAAKMRAYGLRGMAAERSDAAIVREVEELISEAIDASRSLTAELRPPALYESGLVAALLWLSEQMEEKHRLKVHIEADRSAEPPVDQGALLFECVRELLLNIVKYAGVDEAFVHLKEGANELLCITVRDEGAGFDLAKLDGDESVGGFGLFSIRERLRVLGGKMEVESAPGEGTTVRLLAPLARQEQQYAAPKDTRHSDTGEDASEGLKGERPAGVQVIRVLLADDHKIVRTGVASLLKNAPEIEVIAEVGDGKEAVDAANKLRPDVAILDVNMPNMNGIEAAVLIRKRTPSVQVIGLSLHADQQTRQAMLDAGAAVYLPKDSPEEALIAALRELAANPPPSP